MAVIKFYEVGWNYIFGVESIKALRINVEDVSKDFKRVKDSPIQQPLSDFIACRILNKLNEGIRFDGVYFHLEDYFIEQLLNDPEHAYAYFNALVYVKDGNYNLLIFNKPGFIMNENGGTIEKIAGY